MYYYLLLICFMLVAPNDAQNWHFFVPELNCWITQQKVPATWEDAQRNCETDGSILASPLNTKLFEYMKNLIGKHHHSAAYFIGTRANYSNDTVQYISIEGRHLNDMPKAVFDEIDQIDLTEGDCLSMDRLGIRAVSCWDRLPYICYSGGTECGFVTSTTTTTTTSTTTTTTTTTTPPTTPLPPPGYTYVPATGSFYKFHETVRVSWLDANDTCASEGAHVVVLNDAEEADIVAAIGPNSVDRFDLWIWTGLCDYRPGGVVDWRTVNGEPLSEVYNVWSFGHPNNLAPAPACALFNKNDKTMMDRSHFIFNFDVSFTCEISP